MTIRNTQTGETKEINPSEAAQYGITPPSQSSDSGGGSLLSALNPLPQTTKTLTELPAHLAQTQASLPNAKGNLPQAVKNAGVLTGEFAKGIFNPSQLLETALTALGAGAIKAAPTAAKFAMHPAKAIGGALEKKVANAGTPSTDLLQKYLGTIQSPNPKLYQKVGLNDAEPMQKVREILMNTLSSGKDIGGTPSFSDILTKRTGAYGMAKKSFFEPSNQEQRLAKNLGKAYTDIIHEGVPGTKGLDKTLSLFHQTDHPLLKYGLGTFAVQQLLSHLGKGVQGLFSD